jgi:hypothetical protein
MVRANLVFGLFVEKVGDFFNGPFFMFVVVTDGLRDTCRANSGSRNQPVC